MQDPKAGATASDRPRRRAGRWAWPLALAAIAFAWALIANFAMLMFPPFVALENELADVRLETLSPAEPRHERIIVVTIEEETLEQFPYRSPLDRGFLAALLNKLAAYGVAVVGFDILFDQPTEPEKDAMLQRALREFPGSVVVAWGGPAAGLTEIQMAFQDEFLAGVTTADAILRQAGDGTVRRLWTGRMVDGAWRETLPAAIARVAGVAVPRRSMPLAYRPFTEDGSPPFGYFPADAVEFFPPESFAGKIVLIGGNLPQSDRHLTPYSKDFDGVSRNVPGVMIHAHALAQLLDGRRSPYAGPYTQAAVVVLATIFGFALVLLPIAAGFKVLAFLVIGVLGWIAGFVIFALGGPVLPLAAPTLAMAGTASIGELIERYRIERQKRVIRNAFSRYVPHDVVHKIADDPDWLSVRNERREISVIFTDIAGFTTLATKLGIEDLIRLVNGYLDGMSRVVLDHGGTLDKFVGDAVIAFFNAPKDQPDHARRALDCALHMDEVAQAFANQQRAEGIDFGVTRIGVHSGPAAVGNFGGDARFDYTAMGDIMNIGSRLEGASKYFKTRLLVSGEVVDACGADRHYRQVGDVVVKGRDMPVRVFEPMPPERLDESSLEAYRRAYALLEAGDTAAGDAFADLLRRAPDDGLIQFHHDRLAAGESGTLIELEGK